MRCSWLFLICGLFQLLPGQEGPYLYPWLPAGEVREALAERIPTPAGFTRATFAPGSFASWLRRLPLKPAGTPVFLFNKQKKGNQSVHHAVIALDTGPRNLQQCADAVIRLRAEYLFSRGRLNEIAFHFTSGHLSAFTRWARGERPVIRGNRVTWRRTAAADSSHAALRRYLSNLFIYAGSYSLAQEMTPTSIAAITSGDVFVQGGFPGHAVLVVDLARHEQSKEKIFLLAQSYMPAQDMHVLKNLNDPKLSPWYRLPAGAELATPEWTFRATDLRAFHSPTQTVR